MKKLESRTVRELIALARERGIAGYSKLKKAELIKMLAKNLPREIRLDRRAKAAKAPYSKPTLCIAEIGSAPEQKAAKAAPSAVQRNEPAAAAAPIAAPSAESRAPVTSGSPSADPPALPERYADGRMALLPRDPHWLYCFWDLTSEQSRQLWAGERAVLRVVAATAGQEREIERIDLSPGSRSWYVQVPEADRTYRCDLGRVERDGRFERILASNPSTTPPDGIASRSASSFGAAQTDEPGRQADRFFALSAGASVASGLDSAEALSGLHQRLVDALASEALQSSALASAEESEDDSLRG